MSTDIITENDTPETKLIESPLGAIPQHLIDAAQEGGETGLEQMREYLTPPRIKVMQPSRKEPFKSQFEEGVVISTPSNTVICGPDGHFAYTVIFTYDQFCVHNPWERPDDMPYIRESTLDKKSVIAQKCRNYISEPCPEVNGEEIRYMTHINAFILVHGVPELEGVPILLSQYSGEAKSGAHMLDTLNTRCQNGMKIYDHRLMAHQVPRKKGKNEWQGLDHANPGPDVPFGPFIEDPLQTARYKELHKQAKELVDSGRIVVDYDEEGAPAEESEVVPVNSDTL